MCTFGEFDDWGAVMTMQTAAISAACETCPMRSQAFCSAHAPHLSGCTFWTEPKSFEAGATLWTGESQGGFAAVVVSGWVRQLRYTPDGRRQIVMISGPGELLLPLDKRGLGLRLETSTPAVICRLDDRRLDRTMEADAELMRDIYRWRQLKLEQMRWLTACVGMLTSTERICAGLLMAVRLFPFTPTADGQGGSVEIPLPRRDIADLLGVSVETISRVTRSLAREGILGIERADRFEIRNLEALRSRAGLGDIPAPPKPCDLVPRDARQCAVLHGCAK